MRSAGVVDWHDNVVVLGRVRALCPLGASLSLLQLLDKERFVEEHSFGVSFAEDVKAEIDHDVVQPLAVVERVDVMPGRHSFNELEVIVSACLTASLVGPGVVETGCILLRRWVTRIIASWKIDDVGLGTKR